MHKALEFLCIFLAPGPRRNAPQANGPPSPAPGLEELFVPPAPAKAPAPKAPPAKAPPPKQRSALAVARARPQSPRLLTPAAAPAAKSPPVALAPPANPLVNALRGEEGPSRVVAQECATKKTDDLFAPAPCCLAGPGRFSPPLGSGLCTTLLCDTCVSALCALWCQAIGAASRSLSSPSGQKLDSEVVFRQ